MAQIENYSVYNDRMRRSMWDKAFFMDKVPGTELIIDYGCADGSLIRFLHSLFPAMCFIGFDIDPEMIAQANLRRSENTWFFSDADEMLRMIDELGIERRRIAVNFSSVLHEIFHYDCDRAMITRLIGQIAPGYLVARDMMYASDDDGARVSDAATERIRQRLPEYQLQDFERQWGSVSIRRNLAHLILKYKYTENWKRECEENYFSYTMEDLHALLDPAGEYAPILSSRYILPWCRYDAQNRLGLDLGDEFTTHYSLILARKNAEGTISLNAGAGC
ncbi:MAG: hypothetical protein IKU34_02060 [Clostridia bacterium]|nr:hypothetical protein [Clostridia bacterium]